MYYLYIIYSPRINRFYIGVTSNIQRRLSQHNSGASNYTRKKGPWFLVYSEVFETKDEALKRESKIKGWKSRKRIIREFNINIDVFNRQSGPDPC